MNDVPHCHAPETLTVTSPRRVAILDTCAERSARIAAALRNTDFRVVACLDDAVSPVSAVVRSNAEVLALGVERLDAALFERLQQLQMAQPVPVLLCVAGAQLALTPDLQRVGVCACLRGDLRAQPIADTLAQAIARYKPPSRMRSSSSVKPMPENGALARRWCMEALGSPLQPHQI